MNSSIFISTSNTNLSVKRDTIMPDYREADRVFDHYEQKGISRQEFRKRFNAAHDPKRIDADVQEIMRSKAVVNSQKAQIDRAIGRN